MNRIRRILYNTATDSDYRFNILQKMGIYHFCPDEKFLQKKFKASMKYNLSLSRPQTFNEKMQWLKLYDRKPVYTQMVDKYLVRDYVNKTVGKEYLIPLIGVWDRVEDIDFDSLPNQYVLKCNHNSGLGMFICKDKRSIDISQVKRDLERGLKQNYYLYCREWPYKDVQRRIIAEKYMDEGTGEGLRDYKFFCFNGEAKFLYVSKNLDNHKKARMIFLDLDYNPIPITRRDYKVFETIPEKPINFELMIKLANKLSKGIPFVRVDLYEILGKVYFGELTFSNCGGFTPFSEYKQDLMLGKLIELPHKKNM